MNERKANRRVRRALRLSLVETSCCLNMTISLNSFTGVIGLFDALSQLQTRNQPHSMYQLIHLVSLHSGPVDFASFVEVLPS